MANHPLTDAEEKLLHTDLRELLGASQAPDLVDRTLNRLHQPRSVDASPSRIEAPAVTGRRAEARPARWARVRYALEALVLVAAIGLTVWVMVAKSPTEPPRDNGVKGLPRTLAAGPEAQYERDGETIVANAGWFLIGAKSPVVRAAGAEIKEVDGQVLLRIGALPTDVELETIAPWLAQNSWELAMIKNFKRWLQVGGTALLLLSGSALVNGERVQAENVVVVVEAPAPARVATISDIDKLPKDVSEVVCSDVTDGHLERLASVSSLRRVTLQYCSRVSDAGIELLAKNRELTGLDVSNCPRLTAMSLEYIAELKKLTDLTANMSLLLKVPPKGFNQGDVLQKFYSSLARLDVVFDTKPEKADWDDRDMQALVSRLPNITALRMMGVNTSIGDLGLRAASQLASLGVLELNRSSEMSDAGFAYLKECKLLKILQVNGQGVNDGMLEQMAGITSLETLILVGPGVNAENFGVLATLPKLRNLRALSSFIRVSDAARLGGLSSLEELEISLYIADPKAAPDLSDWAKLKNLRSLHMYTRTEQGNSIPPSAQHTQMLPVLPALRTLTCDGETFRNVVAPDLVAQPMLKELRLESGLFEKEKGSQIVAAMSKIATLEIIELPLNGPDVGIDWTPLKNLKSLKEIRVWAAFKSERLAEVVRQIPNCKLTVQ